MFCMWHSGVSLGCSLGVIKALPRLIISACKFDFGFGGFALDCIEEFDFLEASTLKCLNIACILVASFCYICCLNSCISLFSPSSTLILFIFYSLSFLSCNSNWSSTCLTIVLFGCIGCSSINSSCDLAFDENCSWPLMRVLRRCAVLPN